MDLIFKFPLVTHALLALLYVAVLGTPLYLAFGFHGALVAAAIVSAFFYGREAGQREHDLKRAGTNPWLAWLGAEFLFLWSRENWLQWLVPAAVSLAAVLLCGWRLLSNLLNL